jgi:ell wall binding domain 2 (CWB2)
VPARPLLPALLAACAILAGCGLDDDDSGGSVPQLGVRAGQENGARALGFPVTATKNTTRVAGGDAVADAAGVANAVFPATSAATRPKAVTLVDKDNWQAGVAASVLAGDPVGAPILFSDGDGMPPVTSDTLERLQPPGAELARNAQVLLVGDEPQAPGGRRTFAIRADDPYALAGEIDKFVASARGEPSEDVIVTSGERSDYAMPAAAWASFSGDSVLYVKRDELPAATRRALQTHERPDIFILGPESAVGSGVEKQLGDLGRVRRIEGDTPVESALAFTRFSGAGFGWGISQPGQVFTLANAERAQDAAASAALAHNGIFAPLLLTDDAGELPRPLEDYLLDIQPGYEDDPKIQAGSNYFWILGDEAAVSAETQGRIDELTELIPVDYGEPRRESQPAGPGRNRARPDND